jgi:O-succinylbenzoate synthase
MPLKTPFVTHLENVTHRRGIIVQIEDERGNVGYGEGVAFTTPWYTEETVQSSYDVMKAMLIPLLFRHEWKHPREVNQIFSSVRRNHMAKAALETAVWDLYSKKVNQPLWKAIGGTRNEVLSGIVVGTKTIEETMDQIHQAVKAGYTRVKLKVQPGKDLSLIEKVRNQFPELMLFVDANSAYSLDDIEHLQKFDPFQLKMIEQPLAEDDLYDHSLLQKKVNTSICLDESIVTMQNLKNALELKSCQIVNIKIGRVGGLSQAIEMTKLCTTYGVKVWCGGMIEFGISRAFNLALASLAEYDIPNDISGSNRYWEKDIIEPEIVVENGRVLLSERPGIGYDIDHDWLQQITIQIEEFYNRSII